MNEDKVIEMAADLLKKIVENKKLRKDIQRLQKEVFYLKESVKRNCSPETHNLIISKR